MSKANDHQTKRIKALAAAAALLAAAFSPLTARAGDTSAAAQLAPWQAQDGGSASAERGNALFTSRHGGDLSCESCLGTPPTTQGKHASTGKLNEPLAAADHPVRCTDTAKVNK